MKKLKKTGGEDLNKSTEEEEDYVEDIASADPIVSKYARARLTDIAATVIEPGECFDDELLFKNLSCCCFSRKKVFDFKL